MIADDGRQLQDRLLSLTDRDDIDEVVRQRLLRQHRRMQATQTTGTPHLALMSRAALAVGRSGGPVSVDRPTNRGLLPGDEVDQRVDVAAGAGLVPDGR